MERGAADAHRDAALNPTLVEVDELIMLPQEGGNEEAEETDAAAAAARPLAATPSAGVDAARRVVARWRVFVAERKGMTLLRLLALPDLFQQEVLKRLDPFVDRTMVAQVGRPWLAAVLASGLSRLPKGVTVRLRPSEYCTWDVLGEYQPLCSRG